MHSETQSKDNSSAFGQKLEADEEKNSETLFVDVYIQIFVIEKVTMAASPWVA